MIIVMLIIDDDYNIDNFHHNGHFNHDDHAHPLFYQIMK